MTVFHHHIVTRIAVMIGLALLAGCGNNDLRPKQKPEKLMVRFAGAPDGGGIPQLTRAQISTKSGDILILEPDGGVTEVGLDSSQLKEPFAVTEADLMALNSNLSLDLGGFPGIVMPDLPPRKTAQEKMIEAFAARTRPALPEWIEGTEIDPEDFLGVKVAVLNQGKGDDLVSVTANLREGVDADIAFSYATCALAGWATRANTKYGRHVRTLQDTRGGKLIIDVAFTVSDEKPLGLRLMEADDALRKCKSRGIPAA